MMDTNTLIVHKPEWMCHHFQPTSRTTKAGKKETAKRTDKPEIRTTGGNKNQTNLTR